MTKYEVYSDLVEYAGEDKILIDKINHLFHYNMKQLKRKLLMTRFEQNLDGSGKIVYKYFDAGSWVYVVEDYEKIYLTSEDGDWSTNIDVDNEDWAI